MFWFTGIHIFAKYNQLYSGYFESLNGSAAVILCVPLQVWLIRIDIHVLDHCGNIIDCAAVAAITALKHFR